MLKIIFLFSIFVETMKNLMYLNKIFSNIINVFTFTVSFYQFLWGEKEKKKDQKTLNSIVFRIYFLISEKCA